MTVPTNDDENQFDDDQSGLAPRIHLGDSREMLDELPAAQPFRPGDPRENWEEFQSTAAHAIRRTGIDFMGMPDDMSSDEVLMRYGFQDTAKRRYRVIFGLRLDPDVSPRASGRRRGSAFRRVVGNTRAVIRS